MTVDGFLEGVTIGASAGLIAGIVLAFFGWLRSVIHNHFERQEQIRHLARTIELARDDIYSATDVELANKQIGGKLSKTEIQKAYLDELFRQVQQILAGRASRLRFDEIQKVKRAFFILEQNPTWIPNQEGYKGIFGQLEAMDWLGISAHQ